MGVDLITHDRFGLERSQESTNSESKLYNNLISLRGGASNDEQLTGPCIGIDLGTTYSCVAVWRNNRVEVCTNEQGNRITPSYVAFLPDGQRLVGDAAKNQASQNPTKTVFDVKRLIGRKFTDSSVETDKGLFPFELVSNNKGKPVIKIEKCDGAVSTIKS